MRHVWLPVNRDGVEAVVAAVTSVGLQAEGRLPVLWTQHASCQVSEVDGLCPQEASVLIGPSCLLPGAPGCRWQKHWLTQSDMCLVGCSGSSAPGPCCLV